MLGALGTTLFFALTPVFANRAAIQLGSLTANFWRLLVAFVLLGIWAHLGGMGLQGAGRIWFFISGFVGFGFGGLAMFQSLPRLGSNLSTLIVQCGAAVVAAAAEWCWLGTRLTPVQIIFAALTLAGVIVGLRPKSLPTLSPGTFRSGVAWAVLSATGQGFGAVLSRKAFMLAKAAQEHADPATTAYQRAIGGLLVAALALAIGRFWTKERETPFNALQTAWPWVLANALTGPVFGVTCYQWALSANAAGVVQPIVATAPLVTIPFAAKLEGSRPRRGYYLGACLAVAGVAGLYSIR